MKIAHPKTKIGTTLLAKMCFDFMADILTIELGFRQLLLSLENARGKARMHHVKVLTDAAKTDWRASAWLLSHCWPKEFSELATSRHNRRRSANAYWDFQSDGHCEQRPPAFN
jgi:hypothetical protein